MNTWWSFGSQTDYDLDDLLLRGWTVTFIRVSDGSNEIEVEAERNGSTARGRGKLAVDALSQARAVVREAFP